MILIISDEKDITTKEVVDWLLYFKANFKIQNAKTHNVLNSFKINNTDVTVTVNNHNYDDISKIWHRRGGYDFFKISLNSNQNNTSSRDVESLNNYLSKEEKVIGNSLENHYKSKNACYVGSYINEVNNNKLDDLITARKNGLLIPNTLITSSKEELLKFYEEQGTIITKDLKSSVSFSFKNEGYTSIGTFMVTRQMIDKLDDYFFPILVQKKVEKEYEIRVFCYQEKIFPMAIFSQKDKQTVIDYRNYNNEKPNRCVPVKIPKNIEQKLLKLQSDQGLTTCSIDVVYNTENQYVFLEVNPMGQLDWVSKNCNYYIEKYIAEDLTKQ